MLKPAQESKVLRFGVFEVDLRGGELRKAGLRVKLQEQPFHLLAVLLENPGAVVTREQLQQRLWRSDTFVDFEHGLNTAVKKLRRALGDDSDNPRFIETLPRRGYRFIGPLSGMGETGSSWELPISPEDLGAGGRPSPPDVEPLRHEVSSSDRKTELKRSRYKFAVAGAFVAVAVVVTLTLWEIWPEQSNQLSLLRFVQLTEDGQAKAGPITTDGERIYFSEILPGEVLSLMQVSTAGGETAPVPTPLRRPQVLDLSPDGTEILVANQEDGGRDSLWIQPVVGRSPRRMGNLFASDARWGADADTIVFSNGNDVYLANQDGKILRKLLTAANSPQSFRFSPNGHLLRFSLQDQGRDSTVIMESTASGSNLRKLFPGCCGTWTHDGRYFIFESENDGRIDLWARREQRSFSWRRVDRRPTQLTAGPLNFESPVPSKNGKEIFAIGDLPRAEVVRFDSHSREFVPYLSGISAEGLAFSRDGQWVAYTSYPDGALWKSRIDGSDRLQLTFPPMRALLPRWSPDGRQMAFSASSSGRSWNIYLLSAQGGTPHQLLPDAQDRMDANWSPDGNSLVFGSFNVPGIPISIINLKTKHVSTLPDSVGLFSPRWSPDGRYICAITSGRPFKLMLFDFATRHWTQLFAFDMFYPSWSRDGRFIYFRTSHCLSHNGSECIARIRPTDRRVETIVDLRTVGRLTAGSYTGWSGLAPDDSPLLARDISTHEIYALKWVAP